jgi:hypothetical protein
MGALLPFRRPDEMPCPRCGRPVDRDRVRCTHCRAPIVPGADATPSRRVPGWIWIGLLLAALLFLAGALRAGR